MKYDIDCLDFEKVFTRWQHVLSHFKLNQYCLAIADFDPNKPKILFYTFVPDGYGGIKKEIWGHLDRLASERFILSTVWKFLKPFEIGKKQRIIFEYDPHNRKASIEFQSEDEMRLDGSSGRSEAMDSL